MLQEGKSHDELYQLEPGSTHITENLTKLA